MPKFINFWARPRKNLGTHSTRHFRRLNLGVAKDGNVTGDMTN